MMGEAKRHQLAGTCPTAFGIRALGEHDKAAIAQIVCSVVLRDSDRQLAAGACLFRAYMGHAALAALGLI